MTTATGFGLVELDLLATYTGATIPFPLEIPSFGRIPDERDELFGEPAAPPCGTAGSPTRTARPGWPATSPTRYSTGTPPST
jgi:hypothetical protein